MKDKTITMTESIHPKPVIFRQIRELKRKQKTPIEIEKILSSLWYAIEALDFYENINNWTKDEEGNYIDYEQDSYKTLVGQDEGKSAKHAMIRIIKLLKEAGV